MFRTTSLLLTLFTLTIGCTKDPNPTPPEKPTTLTDLGLGDLLLYHSSTDPDPIRIGILLEIPYKDEAEIDADALARVEETLNSMFEGDFSFFNTPPFSDYKDRFEIYYGTMLQSLDPEYTPLDQNTLDRLQQSGQAQSGPFRAATTAQELQGILETIYQNAAIVPDELQDIFYPLEGLILGSEHLDRLEQIPEVPITSSPDQLTPAEQRWLVKKNLLRYQEVFDKQAAFDVQVIVTDDPFGGAQGYAHISTLDDAPDRIFMNRTHPIFDGIVSDFAARTFVHEMGHVAGWFTDEYYPFDTAENEPAKVDCNCVSDGAVGANGQSIDPQTDNPWLQDQLPVEMPDKTLNWSLLSGPVPGYDGSLFPGCDASYRSFRTHEKSIMSFHYFSMNAADFQQGFGPVHRYYMEELFLKP